MKEICFYEFVPDLITFAAIIFLIILARYFLKPIVINNKT